MTRWIRAPTASVLALALPGCASTAASDATGSAVPSASVACDKQLLPTLQAGKLTVGTDTPAYRPHFVDDPSNGEGFESAVTHAVAEEPGFTADEVEWVTVPFNKSYAPGDKGFDFDVNQISVMEKRDTVVDSSDGYYLVNQAVVALQDSAIADATTVAELQRARLGAQVGTTSLDFINEVVQPTQDPMVHIDTNDAKSPLGADQIDTIVLDLPTAYFVTAAEIDDSLIVGQFPAEEGGCSSACCSSRAIHW